MPPDDFSKLEQQAEAFLITPDLAVHVFNFCPDPIVICGPHGFIKLVNISATLVFGYHQSELIGQPVEILLPLDLRTLHSKHRGEYAFKPSHRPMGANMNLEAKRKDGSIFPVKIALAPVQTTKGLYVISYIRQIHG